MAKLVRLFEKIGEFFFWALIPCLIALPFLFLAGWIVHKFVVYPSI